MIYFYGSGRTLLASLCVPMSVPFQCYRPIFVKQHDQYAIEENILV